MTRKQSKIERVTPETLDIKALAQEAMDMGLTNWEAIDYELIPALINQENYVIRRINAGRDTGFDPSYARRTRLMALLYLLAKGEITL